MPSNFYIKRIQPRSASGVLDVLGVPFGGPIDGKDAHGEFFSPNTDFQTEYLELPPVFHRHGGAGGMAPEIIGKTFERWEDESGVWYGVRLDMSKGICKDTIWPHALKDKLYASSGVVPASKVVKDDGEILQWMVGELSLIEWDGAPENQPANYYAVASPRVKQLAEYVKDSKRDEYEDTFIREEKMDEETLKGFLDAFENRISATVSKQLEDFEAKMADATAKCSCVTGRDEGAKSNATKQDSEEIIEDAAKDIVSAVESGADETDVEMMIEDAVVEVVDEIIANEESAMMDEAGEDAEESDMRMSPQKKGAIKRRVNRQMKNIVKAAQANVGKRNQVDPEVSALRKEVGQMREAAALRNDEDWIDEQMALGKVTPDEKSSVLKSLADARSQDGMLKSGGNMHATIKGMIEAKQENLVNAVTAGDLRVAGYGSSDKDQQVDTDYLAKITGGAYSG